MIQILLFIRSRGSHIAIILFALSLFVLTSSDSVQASLFLQQTTQINFFVDAFYIGSGECAVLHWDVENASAIFLDGQEVTAHGTRQVCPTSTTTYTLRVQMNNGEELRTATLNVAPKYPNPVGPETQVEFYAQAFPRVDRYIEVFPGVYGYIPFYECGSARMFMLAATSPRMDGYYGNRFWHIRATVVSDPDQQTFYIVPPSTLPDGEEIPGCPANSPGPTQPPPTPTRAPTPISSRTPTATTTPAATPKMTEVPFGCVGFGTCPTQSIEMGDSSPPRIIVHSVEVDAVGLDGLQVYYPTSIRLTLHNEGGGLRGPADYEIRFDIFDSTGKQLESRVYIPGDEFGLRPLSNIPARQKEIDLAIDRFYFLKAMTNGRMRVRFVPSAGAGDTTAWWIEQVTVRPHPEAFETCLAQVLAAVAAHPDISLKAKATLVVSSAVLETGGCANKATLQDKIWCAAGAIVKLRLGIIKDVHEAIRLLWEVLSQLIQPDGEAPACSSALDWTTAFAEELIRNGFRIDLVGVQSPADLLVTNRAGQRVGFLSGGANVVEIPGSQVLNIGEGQLVIYPADEGATIRLSGTGEGTMSVFLILGAGTQGPIENWYRDMPVTAKTVATIDLSDASHPMAMDTNGDGVIDTVRQPDSANPTSNETPQNTADWLTLSAVIGVVAVSGAISVLLLRARKRKASVRSISDRLQELDQLHRDGLIDDTEFQQKRKEILGQL